MWHIPPSLFAATVLIQLDWLDLVALACTSRAGHSFMHQPSLWRAACASRNGWGPLFASTRVPHPGADAVAAAAAAEQAGASGPTPTHPKPDLCSIKAPQLSWHDTYMQRLQCRHRWSHASASAPLSACLGTAAGPLVQEIHVGKSPVLCLTLLGTRWEHCSLPEPPFQCGEEYHVCAPGPRSAEQPEPGAPTSSAYRRLATGSLDKTTRTYNRSAGLPPLCQWQHHTDGVTAITGFGSGMLATGSNDGSLHTYDWVAGDYVAHLEGGHARQVRDICVLGHGRRRTNMQPEVAVSYAKDGSVAQWNLAQGALLRKLSSFEPLLSMVADEDIIIGGDVEGNCNIWDTETGKLLSRRNDFVSWVTCLRRQGNEFVGGSRGKHLKMCDLRTYRPVTVFMGHDRTVNDCCFQGNYMASASNSVTVPIMVWDVRKSKRHNRVHPLSGGHEDGVIGLRVRGDRLVSGGLDQRACVWDWHQGELLHQLDLSGEVLCMDADDDDVALGLWNGSTVVMSYR